MRSTLRAPEGLGGCARRITHGSGSEGAKLLPHFPQNFDSGGLLSPQAPHSA